MSLDSALDAHMTALKLREERAAVLSSNLINASTPNYQERDFDFAKALRDARSDPAISSTLAMTQTEAGHMTQSPPALNYELEYATPKQAALDKNTVDTDAEQAKFANNTVQYQATLSFIKAHMKGLMVAMQGV